WNEKTVFWEATTGKERRQFIGHGRWLSADGKTLVTTTGWPHLTVRIHDVSTGNERRQFRLHKDDRSAAINADGQMLASGGADGTIRLWDVPTGKELRRLVDPGDAIYQLVFAPESKLLVSTSAQNNCRVWDLATGKMLRQFNQTGWFAAFSPNGKVLA